MCNRIQILSKLLGNEAKQVFHQPSSIIPKQIFSRQKLLSRTPNVTCSNLKVTKPVSFELVLEGLTSDNLVGDSHHGAPMGAVLANS